MTDVALFDLAEQRLGWLDTRQRMAAQNIANADTPAYQPREIVPFDKLLARVTVVPQQTNPMHLAGLLSPLQSSQVRPTERALDGNAVNVEDQLAHVGEDETQQGLVGNLWKSYMGMFMTALGK